MIDRATYSAEKLARCKIRVTAADTGVEEGVERMVPLGKEIDMMCGGDD